MAREKGGSSAGGAIADLERRAAWKYVGYPGFSRFMASSNDCFALRKFTDLNVRVLLKIQNTIVELERRLDEMDNFTMNLPPDEGGCASFRLDANSPREELLEAIEVALTKYNSQLVTFLQIHERPVPSPEQLRNIQTWLANYPNAIENPEQEFVFREKDLFTMQLSRRTHFGKWMESMGLYKIAGFRGADSASSGKYYDRNAWKSLGGLWLMICLLAMLLGPLWALPFALDRAVRLSAVTAFAVAFSMIVTIGTTFKASQRGALVSGYFAQLILVLGFTPAWQGRESAASLTAISPATVTAMATTTASGSVTTQLSIITATPSEAIVSSSTASQTASAQSTSTSGLSTGAKAGIGVGAALGGILILAFVLFICLRRRKARVPPDNFKAISEIQPWSGAKAPSELPDRNSEGMSPPTPSIRLHPAGGQAVASSSTQTVMQAANGATNGTNEKSSHAGNFPSIRPPTYATIKGSKGKGRMVDANPYDSTSTTLGPFSASSPAASQWARERSVAMSTPISAGTTLAPSSAV